MPNDDAERALSLVGLLIEIHQGLIRHLGEVHARYGLQGKEFDALLRLSHSSRQTLRMRDLAAQIGLSTSGVTTLVDRLLAGGWVERVVDPADRRSLLVTLTKQGRAILRRDTTELLPMIQRLVVEPLGDEAAVVSAALERLRDAVNPGAAGAGG